MLFLIKKCFWCSLLFIFCSHCSWKKNWYWYYLMSGCICWVRSSRHFLFNAIIYFLYSDYLRNGTDWLKCILFFIAVSVNIKIPSFINCVVFAHKLLNKIIRKWSFNVMLTCLCYLSVFFLMLLWCVECGDVCVCMCVCSLHRYGDASCLVFSLSNVKLWLNFLNIR